MTPELKAEERSFGTAALPSTALRASRMTECSGAYAMARGGVCLTLDAAALTRYDAFPIIARLVAVIGFDVRGEGNCNDAVMNEWMPSSAAGRSSAMPLQRQQQGR